MLKGLGQKTQPEDYVNRYPELGNASGPPLELIETELEVRQHLGSTDRLVNTAQIVTDSYLYQAFGNAQTLTGTTTNTFRFVGRNGYYFNPDLSSYQARARYYNPTIGRFISRDPLVESLAGYTINGDHFYGYVGNSPSGVTDPSGLARCALFPATLLSNPIQFFTPGTTSILGGYNMTFWGMGTYTPIFASGVYPPFIAFANIFELQATYLSATGFDCKCCSFRQCVKKGGTTIFSTFVPPGATYPVLSQPPDTAYSEDCIPDRSGTMDCYGRQNATNQGWGQNMCVYHMIDYPNILLNSYKAQIQIYARMIPPQKETLTLSKSSSFCQYIFDSCPPFPADPNVCAFAPAAYPREVWHSCFTVSGTGLYTGTP